MEEMNEHKAKTRKGYKKGGTRTEMLFTRGDVSKLTGKHLHLEEDIMGIQSCLPENVGLWSGMSYAFLSGS